MLNHGCLPVGYHRLVATPGPTTLGYTERWAANLLRDARVRRGWSQRRLADAAGVPASTVARIESSTRQPSLITLSRLLAAADLELRIRVDEYDDHDDVLDARRAATSPERRRAADEAFDRTTAVLTASRAVTDVPA